MKKIISSKKSKLILSAFMLLVLGGLVLGTGLLKKGEGETARAASMTIPGGTYIPAGDPTYDDSDIIINSGTVTIDGLHSFNSITITDGGIITHTKGVAGLTLNVTGDITLNNGSIDVSGKGYEGGETGWCTYHAAKFPSSVGSWVHDYYGTDGVGPGGGSSVSPVDPLACPYGAGVGGTYGGAGGIPPTTAGNSYLMSLITVKSTYGDDPNSPVDVGSGGGGGMGGNGVGGSIAGGAGGGAVKIVSGGDINISNGGSIKANGGDAPDSKGAGAGGGSGGSIWIIAGGNINYPPNTFVVEAIGGVGGYSIGWISNMDDGGGGGGGRALISALNYQALQSAYSSNSFLAVSGGGFKGGQGAGGAKGSAGGSAGIVQPPEPEGAPPSPTGETVYNYPNGVLIYTEAETVDWDPSTGKIGGYRNNASIVSGSTEVLTQLLYRMIVTNQSSHNEAVTLNFNLPAGYIFYAMDPNAVYRAGSTETIANNSSAVTNPPNPDATGSITFGTYSAPPGESMIVFRVKVP